jgi:hypothetical protein
MRNVFRRYSKYALGLFVFIFALSVIYWVGGNGFVWPGVVEAKITEETPVFDEANPHIQEVMAVQNRHTHELVAIPEVIGIATGLHKTGTPAILVFAKDKVEARRIPERLEGIPVVVKVIGEILAMQCPSNGTTPTARFPIPVPIGVSTGNIGECSAGTIGARVKRGGNVYALSCNHVYALENTARPGSSVLQPGLYDTKCVHSGYNVIGTLYNYVTINFDRNRGRGGATNTVDAAIAASTAANLCNSTPSNGYGIPHSSTVAAYVGQPVQKYGRTTSLTKGTITGINATVIVTYNSGTATFVNQIIVGSPTAFLQAGDSGSLLVDTNSYPVGLLFAGNSTGTLAVANRIGDVLSSFGVAIDGQ